MRTFFEIFTLVGGFMVGDPRLFDRRVLNLWQVS